jgi:2',3'-cyclic-nucleotide 2'-phosphodiesterase / 3'-nucleotidase
MAGFNGSHVGVIDLHLSRRDDRWAVEDFVCQARPIVQRGKDGRCVPTTASLSPVAGAADSAHLATLGHIRRPVGTTTVPLHSYFAQLGPTAALGLICAAQRAAVAELLCHSACAGLPILSAAAPFKAGGRGGPDNYVDIPSGGLALRHLAGLYHFPNTLRAVRMTGAALAGWLSRAAGQFNQVDAGAQDARLIDPCFPSYNFDLIDGLTYEIDLSAAPGAAGRIRDLRHDGRLLKPEDEFVVATNDYRAAGGGDLIAEGDAELMQDFLVANFDLLLQHVRRAGTVTPQRPKVWRFVSMPGTSVLFKTGLRAAAHLDEIAHLRPVVLGRDDSGFLNLRLHL